MKLTRSSWKSNNGKTYQSVWLTRSYREKGKVKTEYIANLKNCSTAEIDAIELALKHKDNLALLGSVNEVEVKEGLSVGAVWTILEVARRLGIEKALGTSHQAKLALWQVIARVVNQGSRLSAVRLAQVHAACDLLSIDQDFTENSLYANLIWLSEEQKRIEKHLYQIRRGHEKPVLFLYDVTSSYLEGDHNELADYGYNRDRKKGKKQIVIGLLCDEYGVPVSTEVFRGNTSDTQTFVSQIDKAVDRFQCDQVIFVGDRGMIKRGQIEDLKKHGFHYITAITKPQIEVLLSKGILQMSLFDEQVCEVVDQDIRYVVRRNPCRAVDLAESRNDKMKAVLKVIDDRNLYLAEHNRAKVETAIGKVQVKITKLKLTKWLAVESQDRCLKLKVDEAALVEISKLDGCYVLKTDVSPKVADKKTIHDRYKDLTLVEMIFRMEKTFHLETRPVYLRKELRTRGHVLTVMLAAQIRQYLYEAWLPFNITVEEGVKQLSTLCSQELTFSHGGCCIRIPEPRKVSSRLLDAVKVKMPEVLKKSKAKVGTYKKLQNRRKQLNYNKKL